MAKHSWMIYGASGYTGTLIAEEAVRRGHSPILAGRSKEKLLPLAKGLGLEFVALDLEDAEALNAALREVDLVLNAAGPFVMTLPGKFGDNHNADKVSGPRGWHRGDG